MSDPTPPTAAPNLALAAWNRLSRLPLGRQAWSALAGLRVPYFRSIAPTMLALRPGFAEVAMKKRWRVTNHLGTVHAIAMCNLAEFAAGLVAETSTPPTHRWIPRRMSVEYLAKAQTDLRGTCEAPLPTFGDTAFDWTLPVEVRDRAGEVVFRARIEMWISPRPTGPTPAASR
jgi:acyl-coenzyme A thioesterase PaaI-like protein